MPYIGQVCFFCFFMNTRCQCPESWPNKVDPIKRMYKNWTKENFLSRDFILNAENPERVRLAHLARWGSQSVQRNRFTLPARGFSHIIKLPIITSFRPGASVEAPFVSSPCQYYPRINLLHNDMTWTVVTRTFIAPYPRKFGNPPILEILVITWPSPSPTVRPHQRHTNVK